MDKRDFFTLGLPKIKLENKVSLKAALKALGTNHLFNPMTADLSQITGKPELYVGDAIQQAVIEINERGTQAAAVTGFQMVATAIIRSQHVTVDKPFMFVLRDTANGVNLFHGRFSDPRA